MQVGWIYELRSILFLDRLHIVLNFGEVIFTLSRRLNLNVAAWLTIQIFAWIGLNIHFQGFSVVFWHFPLPGDQIGMNTKNKTSSNFPFHTNRESRHVKLVSQKSLGQVLHWNRWIEFYSIQSSDPGEWWVGADCKSFVSCSCKASNTLRRLFLFLKNNRQQRTIHHKASRAEKQKKKTPTTLQQCWHTEVREVKNGLLLAGVASAARGTY